MRDFSLKLGDGEHLESNVTQAIHIMEQAGCDFNQFYSAVVESWEKNLPKDENKKQDGLLLLPSSKTR